VKGDNNILGRSLRKWRGGRRITRSAKGEKEPARDQKREMVRKSREESGKAPRSKKK